jgi:hypothetical protein
LYDVHLFLNEMRKECLRYKSRSTDGFKKTIAFLNEMIPTGYRENTNKYTLRMRLRYGIANYPGLQNLRQILKNKYFQTTRFNVGPYTSANLKQVGLSPNSRNWALGRKKKSPSPVKKKSPSPNNKKNAAKTPGGRIKVRGPTGRLVYADSLKIQNLRNIATRLKLNTNKLTTKAMLAQAIFSKV